MKTKIIIAFSLFLSVQFSNAQSITNKVVSRVLASDNFENQTYWAQCAALGNQLGGSANFSWFNWGGQFACGGVSAIGGNLCLEFGWGSSVTPLTGFVFDVDSIYQIDCLIHPTGGNDGAWNNNSGIHLYATNNTDVWQNSGVRVRISNGETGVGFGNPNVLIVEWWEGANKSYSNTTIKDFSATPTAYSIDGISGANFWIPLKLVLTGEGSVAKPLMIDFYMKDSYVGSTSLNNLSGLGDKMLGLTRYGGGTNHAAFDNFVLTTLKTPVVTDVSSKKATDVLLKYNNINRSLEITAPNIIAANYQVYNMAGKSVLNGMIYSNNALVNVEKIGKGVFVLNVSDNSGITNKTLRFMVQ